MNTNKLWAEDYMMFAAMENHYKSKNERIFFEKLRYKMEHEPTLSNDLLMHEDDNEDHIYIVRCICCEFIIGQTINGSSKEDCHLMNLSDTLSVNLKDAGFTENSITLLEWLRERDYKGIRYDNNFDND